MPITLAIDYGSQYIGLALVRNHSKGNESLFAGTVRYDNFLLKQKVELRAQIETWPTYPKDQEGSPSKARTELNRGRRFARRNPFLGHFL